MLTSSYLLPVQNLLIATRRQRVKGPRCAVLHRYPYQLLKLPGHLGNQPCKTGEQHEACSRGYSTSYTTSKSAAFANRLCFRYKWVVFSHFYTFSMFGLSTHTEQWGIEFSREVSWQTNVEIKFTPKNDWRQRIVVVSLGISERPGAAQNVRSEPSGSNNVSLRKWRRKTEVA